MTLFLLVLLLVVPASLSNVGNTASVTSIVQTVMAQGEDPFPSTDNVTLTPAQQKAREQLLNKEGFTVNVIVRNLSTPLNLLYGPDDALWITERIGKDIVRIDPTNGTRLSSPAYS